MVVDASVSDEAEAGFDGVGVMSSVVDSGDSAGVGDLAVSVQVDAVAVRVHNASRRSSDLYDGSGLLVVRDGGHGGRGGRVVVRDRGRRSWQGGRFGDSVSGLGLDVGLMNRDRSRGG